VKQDLGLAFTHQGELLSGQEVKTGGRYVANKVVVVFLDGLHISGSIKKLRQINPQAEFVAAQI
jgi:hypothetical protein